MPAALSDRIPAMGERLLVQIGSYNTNLQAGAGLPQDLVDWLAPTFHVSSFLSKEQRAPDIVAIGFQELLPLHLGRTSPISHVRMDLNDRHSRWALKVGHRRERCTYTLSDRSACPEQRVLFPPRKGRQRRSRAARVCQR